MYKSTSIESTTDSYGEFLARRVRDGVIRRLIDKWLKAGVWESGRRWVPGEGTPQGGVVSPLLSNIYLHEVMDVWFDREVRPRLQGRAAMFRFADDFVLVFKLRQDAERVLEVIPKRLQRFGLQMHPEKTRLIHFRRPKEKRQGDESRQPKTFQFLGFTHYWGRSRKGRWVVKRRTAGDRLRRSLLRIAQWSEIPAPACSRAAPAAGGQVDWSLCLLWHYRQRSQSGDVSLPGGSYLAQVVGPAFPSGRHDVEAVQPAVGALPIAGSPDLSLCVCSETVTLRNRMRETCSSGSVGELVG